MEDIATRVWGIALDWTPDTISYDTQRTNEHGRQEYEYFEDWLSTHCVFAGHTMHDLICWLI
jgi:hypothetical protein